MTRATKGYRFLLLNIIQQLDDYFELEDLEEINTAVKDLRELNNNLV